MTQEQYPEPLVGWLRYRLEVIDGVRFEKPPPVAWEAEEFYLHLDNGVVTALPKQLFRTEEQARTALEKEFTRWRFFHAMRGRCFFSFVFDHCRLVDLPPLPPGVVRVVGIVSGGTVIGASITAIERKYPDPPSRKIAVTAEVEELWNRWEQYRSRRETLTSAGYYVWTRLEALFGGDKGIARTLVIDQPVLRRLQKLLHKGDRLQARKAGLKEAPHTGPEIQWVETVLRAAIWRVARIAADQTLGLQRLGERDLPQI